MMRFDKGIQLCDYHINKNIKQFHHRKVPLCPSAVNSFTQSLAMIRFVDFPKFHINVIIHCVIFVSGLWCGIMPVRFIHVVECFSGYFLLLRVVVHGTGRSVVDSFTSWWTSSVVYNLDCWNTAMFFWVQVIGWMKFSSLLGKYLGGVLLHRLVTVRV